MAAAVHSNVGLMHATMAMFNAWCDRMPVLVLGATGPVDAPKRRPWIDWIHTARDQGALIRDYTKWDDQPASAEAARESLLRAYWLANSAPHRRRSTSISTPACRRRRSPIRCRRSMRPGLCPTWCRPWRRSRWRSAVAMLRAAKQPVILMGRGSRGEQEWADRVALAETLRARVVTDLKCAAVFPTDHPLHAGAPATFPVQEAAQAIAAADVILSLDWVDLAGALKAACGTVAPAAQGDRRSRSIISSTTAGAWITRRCRRPICSSPPTPTPWSRRCWRICRGRQARDGREPRRRRRSRPVEQATISVAQMTQALRQAIGARPASLLHIVAVVECRAVAVRHPLDYSAATGGGGIGGGPGMAVGAALALRGSGRLPVAVCGDGDFLMGATALWTAVHYNIPLLVVVANNRSFFNDELHQERVARMRNRPVENRWIGQRIADPEIDLAQLARAQGALGFGPVTDGATIWRRHSAMRSRRSKAAASRWSMCASHPATRRPRSPGCSARDGLLVCARFDQAVAEPGVAVRRDRCHAGTATGPDLHAVEHQRSVSGRRPAAAACPATLLR